MAQSDGPCKDGKRPAASIADRGGARVSNVKRECYGKRVTS